MKPNFLQDPTFQITTIISVFAAIIGVIAVPESARFMSIILGFITLAACIIITVLKYKSSIYSHNNTNIIPHAQQEIYNQGRTVYDRSYHNTIPTNNKRSMATSVGTYSFGVSILCAIIFGIIGIVFPGKASQPTAQLAGVMGLLILCGAVALVVTLICIFVLSMKNINTLSKIIYKYPFIVFVLPWIYYILCSIAGWDTRKWIDIIGITFLLFSIEITSIYFISVISDLIAEKVRK